MFVLDGLKIIKKVILLFFKSANILETFAYYYRYVNWLNNNNNTIYKNLVYTQSLLIFYIFFCKNKLHNKIRYWFWFGLLQNHKQKKKHILKELFFFAKLCWIWLNFVIDFILFGILRRFNNLVYENMILFNFGILWFLWISKQSFIKYF